MRLISKNLSKNFSLLRIFLIIANDLSILNTVLLLSYFLRTEEFIYPTDVFVIYLFANIIYVFFFFFFEISKQYFRHFIFNSFGLYFKFFLFYISIFAFFNFVQNINYLPRSLSIIFPIFFFITLLLNRFLVQIFLNKNLKISKKRAVIFGFNEIKLDTLFSFVKIVCFVDDDIQNQKRKVNGISIITTKEFNKNFKLYKFDQILIKNENYFNKSKFIIRKHILEKKIYVQKIRFDDNDLVTEPYFDFNYFFERKNKKTSLGSVYKNKVILITGAGGSIGSNIAFQLLGTQFKKLFLLDNSEFNLYNLTNSLSKNKNIIFCLNNFTDTHFLNDLFKKNKIDIVFHAAAYKHVPLIEFNPFSAIKNNFIDTHNFIGNVIKNKIPYFCLISSDKAVRPTNIMGASKRLAELSLIYHSNIQKNKFSILNSVRFGNVVNSSGSVMPLFQNQINNNKFLTLTHKEITRYFMTIEEASNLVLNVYKIAEGGEVFLLDMGDPIKLYDLAKLMIQFSGKTIKNNNKGDIQIKLIGLRKGEKLYEELLIDKKSEKTSIKSIFKSVEKKMSQNDFENLISSIQNSLKRNDKKSLMKLLNNNFINYKNVDNQ